MNFGSPLGGRRLRRLLAQLLPTLPTLVRPVFILGCGRSGTTILGETLDLHPQLAYLHEPRHIWAYEPRTDIWSEQAERVGGRLRLGVDDVRLESAAKIASAFATEVSRRRATFLVEKLPINSFRVEYIAALFSDARFVHIVRNGIEVARSIARRQAERGLWFGHRDYKWRLIAEQARATGHARLIELCSTAELKGLLEWRLSVVTARAALSRLPRECWLEVRYEDFIEDPAAVCQRLEPFIGIPPHQAMRDFAGAQLARRSQPADMRSISAEAEQIAGALLVELGYL